MKKVLSSIVAAVLLTAAGWLTIEGLQARPVAEARNESAYIILHDDKPEFCPPEGFLAIGKDLQGNDYFGCWRFKDDSKEVVQLIWAQDPTVMFELPREVFEAVVLDEQLRV